MIQVRRNSWNWQLRSEAVLDSWFDDYPKYMTANPVKHNPQRTVFTVGDRYYVKLFTPHKLDDKIRELLSPRARLEFETGIELENAGIPVIQYLGWGRRGVKGMLVTAAEPGVKTLWQRRLEITPELLDKLAVLTRQLIEKNFYHPDYHAGNILYGNDLKLVDVYGILRIGSYGPEQKYRMCRVLLGLKEFISDAEAARFMVSAGIAGTASDAAALWSEYLVRDGARLNKDWEKRSRQIISNYGKFVIVKDGIIYRRMPDESAASLDDAKPREYSPEEAQRLWLESFRKELFGIPCRKPLALKNGNRLYWESAPEPILSDEVKSRIARMQF